MIRLNRRIDVSAQADVCGESAVDNVCLGHKDLVIPVFKPPSVFGVQIGLNSERRLSQSLFSMC